jgi:protein SCO1/2
VRAGARGGVSAAGLAAGLAVLAGTLTGCSAGTSGERPAGSGPAGATAAGFHGVEPAGEVPERASFVLRDTAGQRYDFAAQTAGRPTLLYFGFTSCADECPTAMADIAGALRKTSSDLRGKTRVVFVTTDPARDSPQVLRRWLDRFSTDYVGLVGTPAEVGAAQRAVGLEPAGRQGPQPTLPGRPDQHVHEQGTAPHVHDGPLGYGVDHADVIFAFDADDRQPVLYPGGVRPSDLAADLPLLASGDAS